MFDDLIKIADRLDKIGLHKKANEIDGIILKLSGNETTEVDEFIFGLKNNLVNANLDIDKDKLAQIFEIIEKSRKQYGPKPQERAYDPQDIVAKVATSLVELPRAISQIEKELQSESLEETRRNELLYDLKRYKENLKEYEKILNNWRTGNRSTDKDRYERAMKYINSIKQKFLSENI